MSSGFEIHLGYKFGIPGKETKILNEAQRIIARMDFYDASKNIIYELKPNNAKSIAKGVQQLLRYQELLG